jgi:hypothetical protein
MDNKENPNNNTNEYFSLFYDFFYIEVINNLMNKIFLFFLFFIDPFHLNKKENIQENEIAKPVGVSMTDLNNKFMEREKEKFIGMFSNENMEWNKNMDEEYYNIELYKKSIEHENSEFELKWKRRTLLEHTPRGNIIMYYDVYKKGFAYYCDQQSIHYILLNALAMKYVRLFMCRDLFVDETIDPQCSPSPLIHLEKENVKTENKPKKENIAVDLKQTLKSGPFAKLKKYNQTTTKLEEVVEKNIEKHMNRFLYMGKILNYSFIEKPSKKAKINSILFKGGPGGSGTGIYGAMFEKEHDLQMNVLNYSDFKKKRMNKVE